MALGASGSRWAIATPHEAATAAGADAFEHGGNAVDAALAAAVTLAAVYPHMCGVGGDMFALVQHPEGTGPVAICSSGASPAGIDVGAARATGRGTAMPERGPHTVTVPGAVAGWAALHFHGAGLPWSAAFARGIAAAHDGVPVARSLAGSIAEAGALSAADAAFAALFFPEGTALEEGATLRNPALAATLEQLAAQGPSALYGGEIGARYVDGLRAAGSAISREDLAAHEATIAPPLIGRYRELDVRTTPPTSQGFVMLEALAAIDRLGLAMDPLGPDAGRLALAFAAAALDRDRHLADPNAMRIHVETLLDDGHIAALCDEIRGADAPSGHRPVLAGDTAGLVTADAEGNAVSLIQSLSWGFGSGILEPGTGVIAQNRGTGFTLEAGHPNELEPGKRPAHTLMPVMVHRRGRLAAVSGTMGGSAHPQINSMSLFRALGLGMDAAEAVAAPRWLVGGMDPEDPEGQRFVVAEPGIGEVAVAALASVGFRVDPIHELDEGVGHAHLITVDTDGGLDAGTDPRADGAALAS
jgi:gamma-glutamyltranspeptidase